MSSTALYVCRNIVLSGPLSTDQYASIRQQFGNISALRDLHIDDRNNRLSVEYDQQRLSYLQLLKRLDDMGIAVNKSLLRKLLAQWYDYLDVTARENSSAPEAACCNRPPRQH